MKWTLPLLLAFGCAEPLHLQYDYSRAYTHVYTMQADLTRPSVAEAAYPMGGTEGVELRQRVLESTTDEESGQAEAVKSIGVQ